MTSNLGSQIIMEHGSADPERLERELADILKQSFKPEFLNRVDDIITFQTLSRDELSQIVDIQLGQLKARLAEQGFRLELTEDARQFIVAVGYDPVFGARPLKRAIQRYLQDQLAMEILAGHFADNDTILVDHKPGMDSLSFAVK
jgi:ATP-dependent Clp protease ATP-binding subunit ClpB